MIEWFENRGIDSEIVAEAEIQQNDDWLTFPYFDDFGHVIGTRSGEMVGKYLKDMEREGPLTFYNIQGISLAAKENKPLVICQREIDVLSFKQAGYAWVIGCTDANLIYENLDRFKPINKIILAAEDNPAGRVFNGTVSRIVGEWKCLFVEYLNANDALLKGKLKDVLDNAKNYPVVGLYKPDEFPPMPEEYKITYQTGFGREHDHHIKLMLGKLMVVTGIPGHGKSEWADSLCLNLAKKYGWKLCVCSTEIDNVEYQENTIRRYLRRPLEQVGAHEPQKALDFYQKHYTFITNATMDDDLELTLEKLIELAEIAIIRDGCKVIMLDPWNEIEHARESRETETDYTNRAIRKLKRLAKVHKVLVIIVAHPKMPEQGKLKCPTMYSISGSAHWFNKADYGIILWRENPSGDQSEVRIAKIKRHGAMGKPGKIQVRLNSGTANFEEVT